MLVFIEKVAGSLLIRSTGRRADPQRSEANAG
jgi:hypothetical protein